MISFKEPEDIYAEQQVVHGQGYALWKADPFGDYEVVRIGDVGNLERGKFVPSGNLYDNGHLGKPRINKNSFSTRLPITSKSVTIRDIGMGVDGSSIPAPAVAEGNVKVSCSSTRGAILYCEDENAISQELHLASRNALTQWVVDHHEEISRSANLPLDKLVIITGCTLTGDWQAAIWTSTMKSGSLEGGAGVPGALIKGNFSLTKTQNQSILESVGHGHDGTPVGPNCCEKPKNQCIFIRGLRIKKRLWGVKAIEMKAAAEPKDPETGEDDSNYQGPAISAPLEQHTEIEELPETSAHSDLMYHDEIFDYIFETTPQAEIALVHDDDVFFWSQLDRSIGEFPQIVTNPIQKTAVIRLPQKRALLISVRYRGQKHANRNIEIPDDHNKAYRMKEFLIDKYDYPEENIVTLFESDTEKQPTKANIMEELKALTTFAGLGDSFVFYFTGHASQQFVSDEEDGQDGSIETIWPMDCADKTENFILERELHDVLVEPIMGIKCRLNTIIDLCHGETILDLSGAINFTVQDVRDVTDMVNFDRPIVGGPIADPDFSPSQMPPPELYGDFETPQLPMEDDAIPQDDNVEPEVHEPPHVEGQEPVLDETVQPAVDVIPTMETIEGEVAEQPEAQQAQELEEAEQGQEQDDTAFLPPIKYDQQFIDNAPFGPGIPDGAPNKFQVARGKIGLRENYISISSPAFEEPVDKVEGPSILPIQPEAPARIIHFSRRAALRPQQEEPEEEEVVGQFPRNIEVNEAGEQIAPPANPMEGYDDVLNRTNEAIENLPPTSTSRLLLETMQEGMLKIPESRGIAGPSDLLARQFIFFARFITARTWLLQDVPAEIMRMRRQELLLLLFDISAFYSRCIHAEYEFKHHLMNQQRKEEEDGANSDYCREFEGRLRDRFEELKSVKRADLRQDPTGNALMRDENSYLPQMPDPTRAIITSWTVCLPKDWYWAQENRPAGIDTALIDILSETSNMSYRTLIQELTQQLGTAITERHMDAAGMTILTDRAQLSSLQTLDLEATVVF